MQLKRLYYTQTQCAVATKGSSSGLGAWGVFVCWRYWCDRYCSCEYKPRAGGIAADGTVALTSFGMSISVSRLA